MKRKPTEQQAACIEAVKANDFLKISAVAGSGKTSTLTMIAEEVVRPSLYLAFNKVTAEEAAQKFPKHVTCKTTHGVAYAAFGTKIRDKLSRPKGKYQNVAGTGGEIARYFKMRSIELDDDSILADSFLGLMVKQAVAKFEQSADSKIEKKHCVSAELFEKKLRIADKWDYIISVVLENARKLWAERIDVRSPVLATHDTYLKMWQLSKPVLYGYEVLYVDECQDSTPCVLDVVANQRGHMKVVAVGDERQAIYGWRGAVNGMKLMPGIEKNLTKSFRYGQAVADVATTVLEGAMKITGFEKIDSKVGMDVVDRSKPYTRLFRTNAALLVAAVDEIRKGTDISIEIDVKDFVKLLESAVALRNKDLKAVKHDKVVPYQTWDEMVLEAKHDPELTRIAKLVGEGDAEMYIEVLNSHYNSREPHVTFTTAHKSKGREWSQVAIESDFKSCYNEAGWVGLPEEEQNLLYVACTRAIERLDYNQTVVEYLGKEREDAYGYDAGYMPDVDSQFKAFIGNELRAQRRLVRDCIYG